MESFTLPVTGEGMAPFLHVQTGKNTKIIPMGEHVVMRTKTKRMVSLLLVLVMCLSISCSVFAATPESVGKYSTYLCLGDSVAAGYGQPQYNSYGELVHLWDRISGSYPDVLANYVHADTMYPYAIPGLSSQTLRYLFDDSYDGGHLLNTSQISNLTAEAFDKETLTSWRPKYREAAAKADLITLDIGLNDTWEGAIGLVYEIAEYGTPLGGDPRDTLQKELAKYGTWDTVSRNVQAYLTAWALNPDKIAYWISEWISFLLSYFTDFSANFPAIVDQLFQLNPDAIIVAPTSFNSFKSFQLIPGERGAYLLTIKTTTGDPLQIAGFTIPKEIHISSTLLGNIPQGSYDFCYDAVREAMEVKYPGQFFVANVGEVELIGDHLTAPLFENQTMDNTGYNPHPTTAGHKYIADQILAVLPDSTTPYDPSQPSQPDDQGYPAVHDNCPSVKYSDLNTSMWYHEPVDYVLNRGIMTGYTDTTWEPFANITRAQVATILYAMEGKPAVTTSAGFTDVATDAWYVNPVNWAAASGVVAGMGDGTFAPDANVTREQLATMLRSYAEFKGKNVTATGNVSTFADAASISSWATEPVSWAVGAGLINGRDGNMIAPQGTATRAEAATMFWRFNTGVMGN